MKKIGMVSLGCPKNTVDTELALGDLLKNGYQWTATHEEADVLIVNTCGFIESSKKESIDAIFEMAQMKTDGKCSKLVVTGCLSQRYGEELIHEIPEIDLLMGVDGYPQLKNLLEKESSNSDEDRKPTIIPEYFESYGQRELITPFYSTYLKIGEGCVLKFADNALTKGVIQSFGITLPIIGRVSGIDIINYIAHNNGNIMPKSSKPFIALGASKVVQAGNLVIPKFATGGQNVAGTPAQTGIGF